MDNILLYEELSLNAHPALQTQFYDGWALRFANGYTHRANSVNPLYPSALDPRIKIAECEKRYFAQGLPAVYKLTDGSDPNIGKALDERGYAVVTPTYVMNMDLQDKDFASGDFVMTDHADGDWLNAYFTFSRYTDKVKMTTAGQILANVKNTMICGRIVKNGAAVACGSAVIERGYMALLNIVVDEAQRGKGFGAEICESLLAAAKRLGAHTAYLQVVRDNRKAVNLYTKLGYETVYSYWYRVKEEYP
ncbi:MAG: GNAT family N-acetyltransferase [Peptococcaceae bacterium]|jgi:ribosomal protein S18 acetylase RimI-like enzyme|nr:GNAT family N-acetyltransferase [Peptococcaceae bacterium]